MLFRNSCFNFSLNIEQDIIESFNISASKHANIDINLSFRFPFARLICESISLRPMRSFLFNNV